MNLKISWIELLTIVFVTLKLTSVISWSWWWVLSPVLIGWSVAILLVIIAVIFNYEN